MSVGLQRSMLSSDLASAVTTLIAEQDLAAGQAIPALRGLAERFGVAVPTMREALRRLEGMGIVEFRHGSGIFVGPNARRLVLANSLAPRPTQGQLEQLLAARAVIEPPIAALAASVRLPAALQRLEQSLALARELLDQDDERLATANVDIHRGIAAVTGNVVLAQTLDSLAAVHAQDQAEILVLHGNPEQDFREHESIVGHIAAGDVDAARQAMHQHLTDVMAVVAARSRTAANPDDAQADPFPPVPSAAAPSSTVRSPTAPAPALISPAASSNHARSTC